VGVLAVVLIAGAAAAFFLSARDGGGGLFADEATPTPPVPVVDLDRLPDGERVAPDLAAPEAYAGLVILPAGSTPVACGVPVPFGRTQVDVEIEGSVDVERFRPHALFLDVAPPAGWSIASARVHRVTWDDGSYTDSAYVAVYERESAPGTVTITRAVIETGCSPEIVNRGADLGHALTKGTAGGHEVLYFHRDPDVSEDPVLNALWVEGNIHTTIESSGILIEDIEAFIAAYSG